MINFSKLFRFRVLGITLYYRWSSLKARVLYGKMGEIHQTFIAYLIAFMVMRRLRAKCYSIEERLNILDRYARMLKYKSEKEVKEGRKEMMEKIVNISERTNIPQWQLRHILQRDFKVDI